MYHICICEDEQEVLLQLSEKIEKELEKLEIVADYTLIHDSRVLMEQIRKNSIDILFLDIDMPYHNGMDIAGSVGDEIRAIGDGIVTELTHHELWGTIVTIDHYNGFTAKYSGLQKEGTIQPGQEVKENQKIGVLGEIPIEKADGIHLHFELLKNGKFISPTTYLGKEVEI